MGILNSKERIMDTILTTEGRRQIARNSSLNAKYYSFTDMGAIYQMDTIVSSSLSVGGLPFNETYRIALEASNLPQDTIVYETDDAGRLNAVRPNVASANNNPISVRAGTVFIITGSRTSEVIDNDTFASLSDGIVSSSINSFIDQMILASPDPMDSETKKFLIGPLHPVSTDGRVEGYTITSTGPIVTKENGIYEANIDNVESLFFDRKLSNVSNFLFLPPINKKISEADSLPIGNYVRLQQDPILKYEDLKPELDKLEQMGFGTSVNFIETSRQNNIMCQLFELDVNKIGRLDVIDFGTTQTINNSGTTETKHIFFCGKVFNDSFGAATYVNMFTIVFNIESESNNSI